MVSKTLILAAAGLATAGPLCGRAPFPPMNTAEAFTLIANVTDTAKAASLFPDIDIQGLRINAIQLSEGHNPLFLNPVTRNVFFVNGTAADVSAGATSIAIPPREHNGRFLPQGLQFTAGATPGLLEVGSNIGFPHTGAGIRGGLRSPYPTAFAPASGTFVACVNEPLIPRAVKFATGTVPENCVAINLLAQCSELTLPNAGPVLNLSPVPVSCYKDVSAIDWSKY
ncbi:hypothetical protein QBC35DRAFT_119048 [Podospora australis]|uniref:DUF7907 domain-containing protein n=1 Tax=Podospora australis TaxID=1536484 RepID=A0AAN6WN23_9PEZI|nr:hypothetical protein QBC35DRAFT_119048 [Podospora australis]